MASPQPERFAMTPSSSRLLSLTPGSKVLRTPLSDESLWKRLKEAGFDEESIKRRDKAALIGYIAKLEAELFDHQHQMGLLIMERKELSSKYEQLKVSLETAEILRKQDQATNLSALADVRKREENLKKTIGVKEECVASMEKSLHEMRVESAETKVAADVKLAKARCMMEDSEKRFSEAEAKLRTAESLRGEATRYQRVAERKLQEVEEREDDLRSRIATFSSDCEKKEKEISLERQSLLERQRILQQEHDRLLDAQASLNKREDYIFSRSQELNRLEKESEDSKRDIEKQRCLLNDEKSNLELIKASLRSREEALNKREALLNDKEQELLALRERLTNKASSEVQKAIANHEIDMKRRKAAFDSELEMKRKSVEDDLEAKRRAWELREVDLSQREDLIKEREYDLDVKTIILKDKEKELAELSTLLDEKEKILRASEKEIDLNKIVLQREKDEITKMKLDLDSSLNSLENRKQLLDCANEKLEDLKMEKSELYVLETKLKEEIDSVRAQKLELMAEVDKLAAEKAKFEAEWELIDEKREELRKESERVAEERLAFSMFIKDEHDSLRQEKDEIHNQYKHNVEVLCCEREDFMNKMAQQRSEWFSKMQQERTDLLLDIEMQRKDLENCIEKKREELESLLREKEITFEQEKKNELQRINFLKERLAKESEQVALEMKRLETERTEINLDRGKRNQEWDELNNAIEELKLQSEKLKRQRELLHLDRKEIQDQIERLRKLENVKIALDNMALTEADQSDLVSNQHEVSVKEVCKQSASFQIANFTHIKNNVNSTSNGSDSPSFVKADGVSPPSSARISWIKKCSDLIFRSSPEKPKLKYDNNSPISNLEDEGMIAENVFMSGKCDGQYTGNKKSPRIAGERQMPRHSLYEAKVIVEVPQLGEAEIGVHDVDSKVTEVASEWHNPSISGQGVQGTRKRNNSSHNYFVPSLEEGHNIKKRRQLHQDSVNPSEQTITECTISSRRDVLEDQHVSILSNQTCGNAEEASLSVVNKTIKVSELACEQLETTDCNEKPSCDLITEAEHSVGLNNEKGDDNLGSQSGWNATNPDARENRQEVSLGKC